MKNDPEITFWAYKGFRGEKYWKVDKTKDVVRVIQITISCGEMKRGRGNMYGIATTSWQSFATNYATSKDCERVPEAIYLKAFQTVIEQLWK